MNQSNKKYLEFFKDSGINYFLQENPRNWFDKTDKIKIKSNKNEDNNKAIKIQNVINKIKSYETPLKRNAKNLVVFDGSLNAKVMFIGEAPGRDDQ